MVLRITSAKINCIFNYVVPKLRRSTSGGKGVPTNAKVITKMHDNYSINRSVFYNTHAIKNNRCKNNETAIYTDFCFCLQLPRTKFR